MRNANHKPPQSCSDKRRFVYRPSVPDIFPAHNPFFKNLALSQDPVGYSIANSIIMKLPSLFLSFPLIGTSLYSVSARGNYRIPALQNQFPSYDQQITLSGKPAKVSPRGEGTNSKIERAREILPKVQESIKHVDKDIDEDLEQLKRPKEEGGAWFDASLMRLGDELEKQAKDLRELAGDATALGRNVAQVAVVGSLLICITCSYL